MTLEFDEETHTYLLDGVKVPSVTKIIGDVVPKDLSWWGMQVGVAGALEVLGEFYSEHEWPLTEWTSDEVITLMQQRKLTVRDVRGDAADRGNAVHKALEDWANEGKAPNPGDHPENVRPYLQALAKFLIEAEPVFLQSEVRVASEEGYAGTFDALIALPEDRSLVTNVTPKRGAHRSLVKAGRYRVDAKTSKRIIPLAYFPQLAFYEKGAVEMGHPGSDGLVVLHLRGDGEYVFCIGSCDEEDALILLRAYEAQQRIKAANSKRKAAKA